MNTQTLHITAIEMIPKVDIKSVICVRCNLVHLLDADGHCEFCRRRLASPPKTTWELVVALLGLWFSAFGLRRPKTEDQRPADSVFKDHGTAALPPSVVSD